MLIALSWLKEYCPVSDLSTAEISSLLTSLGLEVEAVKSIPELDQKVVVGEILTAVKHPQADSLQICAVKVGDGQELKIVCGAANARPGLKVAVAQIGAVLPGGLEIKPSKIRQETSEGMLCSENELTISSADSGILELPLNYELGRSLSEYVSIADTVFEISVTPNRPDCLSYIGVARDLAAKLGRSLSLPNLEFSRDSSFKVEQFCKTIVSDSGNCNRFVTYAAKNLKPLPSPGWMQRRLLASGMRPINAIVDISNYVMLETGQPLHIYDRRSIADGMLQVISAKGSEDFSTLDGQNVKLRSGDLLIADGQKIVGLAGIMGGANSQINDDTSEVVIEVAQFDPGQIRRTAKHLGLRTEASYRFERGVDVENQKWVAERVASLLSLCLKEQGYDKAIFAAEPTDVYPHINPRKRIALRLRRCRQILALPHLTLNRIVQHLQALGLSLLDQTDERMLFEIPTWRHDIVREIDLIEEVGRLEGYDKIPYELPKMVIAPNFEDPYLTFSERVKETLAQRGFTEVLTFPFQAVDDYRKLNLTDSHPLWPTIYLANPLSEEMNALQTHLIPGLLQAAVRNRHRGKEGVRLFQVARGYFDHRRVNIDTKVHPAFAELLRHGRHLTHRAAQEKNRPVERHWFAAVLTNPWLTKNWQYQELSPSVYQMKTEVEALLKVFGMGQVTVRRPMAGELPFLHPHASAVILNQHGAYVGYWGELHPAVAEAYEFSYDSPPVVCELDVERCFELSQVGLQISPVTKRFPPVTRDFAFVVEASLNYEAFDRAISEFADRKFLSDVSLFDVYQGAAIPVGKKSFAITAVFHAPDRTLTDKEVDSEFEKLKAWLAKSCGAALRD